MASGSGPVQTIPFTGAPPADQQVVLGDVVYHGFTVRETAGAVASFILRGGTSTAGKVADEVTLAANESAREFYERGITLDGGLFLDILAGSIEGAARVS